MRKKKPGGPRLVKTTRWTHDEWELITYKADMLKMSPSEYVRRKALDTPPSYKPPGTRRRSVAA